MGNNWGCADDDRAAPLCYVAEDSDSAILGGAIGVIFWEWLSLDLIWVWKDLRGHGNGGCLLGLIEEEARKQGAKHAHLDTLSFQAPEFYKNLG